MHTVYSKAYLQQSTGLPNIPTGIDKLNMSVLFED